MSITLAVHAAAAQTAPSGDDVVADAKSFALNCPALITPRALQGVYNDVAHAGPRLVAVGERGWILASDDNGASWTQMASPTSVTLTKIAFDTPQDGWAIGGMGVVLHSVDAGQNWKLVWNGEQAAAQALADASAASKAAPNSAAETQNLQTAQQMVQSGPTVPFLSLLATPQDIFLGGAFGMAFSSADHGASWHSLADAVPNPNGLHIYSIQQQYGQLYVVGEEGLVLQGKPGAPLATLNPPFQGTFFGQVFTSASWIIYGLQGTVLRSTDKGAQWTQSATTASVGIDAGMVVKDGDVLLGDVAGDLLLSHDDGQNFITIRAGAPVLALTQAGDGAIIAATAAGMKRLAPSSLAAGT